MHRILEKILMADVYDAPNEKIHKIQNYNLKNRKNTFSIDL